MMGEHTKGAWVAEPEYEYELATFVHSGGDPIADCAFGRGAEDESNARLIAAAPDLLAALENLVDFCEQVFVKPNECDDIIAARAAIHIAKHGAPSSTDEEAV